MAATFFGARAIRIGARQRALHWACNNDLFYILSRARVVRSNFSVIKYLKVCSCCPCKESIGLPFFVLLLSLVPSLPVLAPHAVNF